MIWSEIFVLTRIKPCGKSYGQDSSSCGDHQRRCFRGWAMSFPIRTELFLIHVQKLRKKLKKNSCFWFLIFDFNAWTCQRCWNLSEDNKTMITRNVLSYSKVKSHELESKRKWTERNWLLYMVPVQLYRLHNYVKVIGPIKCWQIGCGNLKELVDVKSLQTLEHLLFFQRRNL